MRPLQLAAVQAVLVFSMLLIIGLIMTFAGTDNASSVNSLPTKPDAETKRGPPVLDMSAAYRADRLLWPARVGAGEERMFESSVKDASDSNRRSRGSRYSETDTSSDKEHNELLSFESPYILSDQDQNKDNKDRKTKDKEKKTVAWFQTDGFREVLTFDGCQVPDCKMVPPEKGVSADAVIFHGVDGRELPPTRVHPDQVYVLYDMESPLKVTHRYWADEWNGVFNWTWTYRLDSDIWEPIFYLRRNGGKVPPRSFFTELAQKKTRPVAWFVSDCDVPSEREEYIQELKNYIDVDVFGDCGNLSCPRSNKQECFDLLTDHYFFYLSFENAYCVDYVTEKLFNMYDEDVHLIPVVMGGADYLTYFPPSTYIDVNAFATPRDLGRFLQAVMSDPDLYAWYLWRKTHFIREGRGVQRASCELCSRLHDLGTYRKSYSNIRAWRWADGQCSPPKHQHM